MDILIGAIVCLGYPIILRSLELWLINHKDKLNKWIKKKRPDE